MKNRIAAGLLGLGLFCAPAAASDGVPLGKCLADDQIPSAIRGDIQTIATNFARKIADHDLTGAFERLSADADADAKQNKSTDRIAGLLDQIGKLHDVKLDHVFYLNAGGTWTLISMNCSAQYAISALANKPNAYAVLSLQSESYSWAISLWFEPASDGWRVRNFSINNSGVLGKNTADFIAMARAERQAGHLFNAHMLYFTAAIIAKRGDILQLRISETLSPELAAFQGPDELRTDFPATWTLSGRAYSVGDINMFSEGGKLGLRFDLPNQSWSSDEIADAKCRAFLDDFRAAHPEWRPQFGKLQVVLTAPDKKTTFVRTYTDGNGYDSDVKSGHA